MFILAVLSIVFYILGYLRMVFVCPALILQLAYIFSRGIQLSRLPLVGPHDTLFFLSASLVIFAIPVAWKMKNRKMFVNSLITLAVFFLSLSLIYKPHNFPLPPVLKTFWFETHVAFSFFSYALFGIGALLGMLFLLNKGKIYTPDITKKFISKAPSPLPSPARGEGCNISPPLTPLEIATLTGLTGGDEGKGDVYGFINDRISNLSNPPPPPSAKEDMGGLIISSEDRIEPLQYKIILVGYCFFSLAMIFGGIWAYLAWGTYWLWTPKELWTVILWLFYSLYLHARLMKWWAGKPAAILGIAGFFIVMFTYLGVSLLLKSSHTF